jgi:transcriptional regulator with XRE-family HTH domain
MVIQSLTDVYARVYVRYWQAMVSKQRNHVVPELARLRKARGLSQPKLAALAGISQPVLWRYERGDNEPKGLKSALALAAVLRCKVTDIWPHLAPQRVPKHRRPHRAPTGAGRRRTTLKNQGPAKG